MATAMDTPLSTNTRHSRTDDIMDTGGGIITSLTTSMPTASATAKAGTGKATIRVWVEEEEVACTLEHRQRLVTDTAAARTDTKQRAIVS